MCDATLNYFRNLTRRQQLALALVLVATAAFAAVGAAVTVDFWLPPLTTMLLVVFAIWGIRLYFSHRRQSEALTHAEELRSIVAELLHWTCSTPLVKNPPTAALEHIFDPQMVFLHSRLIPLAFVSSTTWGVLVRLHLISPLDELNCYLLACYLHNAAEHFCRTKPLVGTDNAPLVGVYCVEVVGSTVQLGYLWTDTAEARDFAARSRPAQTVPHFDFMERGLQDGDTI